MWFEEWILAFLYYSCPVLFLCGMVGNAVGFVVFSRPRFQKTPFWIYYRFMALTDSVTLCYIMVSLFTNRFVDFHFYNMSYVLCKCFYYVLFAVGPMSAHICVVVSLDRLVGIYFPKRFTKLADVRFQLGVVLLIVLFNVSFYTPLVVFYNLSPAGSANATSGSALNGSALLSYEPAATSLSCNMNAAGTFVFTMDLYNSTVVPFAFMLLVTSLTLGKIVSSRRQSGAKRLSNRDVRFAITSVTFNVTFFVLNLPVTIYNVANSSLDFHDFMSQVYYLVTGLLYYINYALFFYLNYFANSIFKSEFLAMLYGKRRPTKKKAQTTDGASVTNSMTDTKIN